MTEQEALGAAAGFPVVAVQRLDLKFTPRRWPFAEARRAEIDAYFARLQQDKPALYNGRVLILHRHVIADAVLQGEWLETDFASFIAWRDWDFPDASVTNGFALGAIRGNDGAFLLGVMGAHTINAGRIYFPGGTPDPSDIVQSRVDLEGSVRREIAEETGLAPDAFEIGTDWTAVLAGPRIALIKIFQACEPAAALRRRILDRIAADPTPELADIRVVRGPSDLDPMMPSFVPAFLRDFWQREQTAMSEC